MTLLGVQDVKEYYLSFVRVWCDAGMEYSVLEQVQVEDVQYIGHDLNGCIVWLKDGRSLRVKPHTMIRFHE